MSLPKSILPPNVPIGQVNDAGQVMMDKNWWLLIYNIVQNVLGPIGPVSGGGSTGVPSNALSDLYSVDSDATDTDAIMLRKPVDNLALQLGSFGEDESMYLRSQIQNALILAQDSMLPDSPAAAQPVQSITVGASPFSYTAAFSGSVTVTAGTVSLISIVRQGTTVATGVTTGIFPAARGDVVQVTYTVAPTMKFLPS